MNKMMLALTAIAAAAFLVPAPATAIVGANTHGYDAVPAFAEVGTTYLGFTYSSGNVALCVPSYNYFGYPPDPRSPICVIYNPFGSGTITATDPLHWFMGVTGYCSTAAPFINPNGISIEATDILGTVSRTTCKGNYASPGSTFSLSSALPASSLKIHDTGNYYVYDHLIFTSLI